MDPMQDLEMEIDLRHYWAIIRRWWYLILATTVLAAVAALVVSLNMTPIYKATAQVRIQQASSPGSVDTYSDIIASERLARTYAKLMIARPVLEQALAELGLTDVVDVEELSERVSANPVRDTTLVEVSVEDPDPTRAVQLANIIPQVFARQNEALQRSRFEESKRNLQNQLRTLEEELAQVQQQLADLRSREDADPAEVLRLEAQVTSLQTSYANLLRQFEEVRLAEAQAVDTIVLSEPAVEARKVRPKVLLNTLLAAILGLMVGVGAVFLREYLDDTVKGPDEVERLYQVPVLAGIPEAPSSSTEDAGQSEDVTGSSRKDEVPPVVVHREATTPAAEAFRVLRTNLQFASVDSEARTLMITSPEPQEGKSFVAANLAVALSEMGQRVLLIDGDLRRPRQHKIFHLPRNVGLSTALLAPLEEVDTHIHETAFEGLYVMPRGPEVPNPTELLGSQRMRALMAYLAQKWDAVILDTPPVLIGADAAIASRLVSGVLLVCRAGTTRHPALQQALKELERVNARIFGMVMNVVPQGRGGYYDYYYYRYYGYRYDYYSTDGQQPRRRGRKGRKPEGWWERLRHAVQRR